MVALPLVRLFEAGYCKRYYEQRDPSKIAPDGSLLEEYCKVDLIQQQLAWLGGIVGIVAVACDLTIAIPFGIVSDRWGRMPVLRLCCFSIVFMMLWYALVGYFDNIFPIEAMVVGPLFSLFGGGDTVVLSVLLAYLSDLVPDAVERATAFAHVTAISYAVSMLGPAAAAIPMERSVWLAYGISIGLAFCSLLLVMTMPETPKASATPSSFTDDTSAEEETPLLSTEEEGHVAVDAENKTNVSMWQLFVDEVKSIVRLLVGRRNFQVLLMAVMLAACASSSSGIMTQYISKRYNWKLGQVGYILSVKAVVNLLLISLAVPWLLRLLVRRLGKSAIWANVVLAISSLVVSTTGCAFVGLAPSIGFALPALAFYALGSATPVFAFTLIKTPAVTGLEEQTSARAYTLVGMAKTIGGLVGAPVMPAAWVKAISLKGVGYGLPFYVGSVSFVRLPLQHQLILQALYLLGALVIVWATTRRKDAT